VTFAQDPPVSGAPCVPCNGKCLTVEEVGKLREAIDELEDIHNSPAVVEFQDQLVIVRDWDGRVYGKKKARVYI